MPVNLQIRHVPDDVHAELRRRAAARGWSLQELLYEIVVTEARRPALDELLAPLDRLPATDATPESIVQAVRDDRAR